MFKHEIFTSELSEPKQKLTVQLEDGTEFKPAMVSSNSKNIEGMQLAGTAIRYRIGESEWRNYDRIMFTFKFE